MPVVAWEKWDFLLATNRIGQIWNNMPTNHDSYAYIVLMLQSLFSQGLTSLLPKHVSSDYQLENWNQPTTVTLSHLQWSTATLCKHMCKHAVNLNRIVERPVHTKVIKACIILPCFARRMHCVSTTCFTRRLHRNVDRHACRCCIDINYMSIIIHSDYRRGYIDVRGRLFLYLPVCLSAA